jgi:hypothetical protein
MKSATTPSSSTIPRPSTPKRSAWFARAMRVLLAASGWALLVPMLLLGG